MTWTTRAWIAVLTTLLGACGDEPDPTADDAACEPTYGAATTTCADQHSRNMCEDYTGAGYRPVVQPCPADLPWCEAGRCVCRLECTVGHAVCDGNAARFCAFTAGWVDNGGHRRECSAWGIDPCPSACRDGTCIN